VSEQEELNKAHKQAHERVSAVSETMSGLKRDMDKCRLLVENFAPHLLGQLPPADPE